MIIDNLQAKLLCPICQNPLKISEKTWQCEQSHNFDVAKQGYVNLLPVQHKKSKNPGDTEQAVLARQRFLNQGYYQAFCQQLNEFSQPVIADFVKKQPTTSLCWLDIGCGEGYYSEHLFKNAQNLLANTPSSQQCISQQYIALDISKSAVIHTAKRLKPLNNLLKQSDKNSCCYSVVASASQVPLADDSVMMLSSIFSPILPQEFARLLTTGGFLLIGKPNVSHLVEMRQAIFERIDAHDSDKFIEQLAPSFTLIAKQQVRYPMDLTKEALTDLLAMTPYAYRAKPEKIQQLLATFDPATQAEQHKSTVRITVDFVMYLFRKN